MKKGKMRFGSGPLAKWVGSGLKRFRRAEPMQFTRSPSKAWTGPELMVVDSAGLNMPRPGA